MKTSILFTLLIIFSIQKSIAYSDHYDGIIKDMVPSNDKDNNRFRYIAEGIADLDVYRVEHNLKDLTSDLSKEDKQKLLNLIKIVEWDINSGYEAGKLKILLFFGLGSGISYILKERGDQLAIRYSGKIIIAVSLMSIIAGTYFGFRLIDKIDDWRVKPRKMKELEKIKQIIDGVKINEN